MTTAMLTEKQRRAMEARQAAQAAGMGLSAYARTQGLDPRELHDAVAALRRRGVLPASDRPRPRKSRFVAVRVAEAATVRPGRSLDRAGLRPMVMRLELWRGRLAQIELADTEQLMAILRALDHAA